MSILNKKKCEEVRIRHKDDWLGRISTNLMNCLDTITDRDNTIETLQSRVKELENRPHRPLPVNVQHKADCNLENTSRILHKGYVSLACTCGAVKEPEVMMVEEYTAKETDKDFIRVPKEV